MGRRFGVVVFAAVIQLSCSSSTDLGETTTALSEDEGSSAPVESLPASAAGESSETGPGVPADFSGIVTSSIPATQEELDAIAAAAALQAQRNPPTKKPTDLGFGRNPEKPAPVLDGAK